jgi:hypothetical protein
MEGDVLVLHGYIYDDLVAVVSSSPGVSLRKEHTEALSNNKLIQLLLTIWVSGRFTIHVRYREC